MRARAALGLTGQVLGLAGCGSTVAGTASPGDGASGETVSCAWAQQDGGPAVDADQPPDDVPARGTAVLRMATGQGGLTLTLDRAAAPCASAALVALAEQGFFDGSPCHRETDTDGLQVLQCGDPTGTGAGGPPWTYPTDVDGRETYSRGTVAMANSGRGHDGSQFFLVWDDSTNLNRQPNYTIFGRMDSASRDVVAQIAGEGQDGSNPDGTGKPNNPAEITKVTKG